MNLLEIDDRNVALIDKLTIVWRKSVEATHSFLTPEEIDRIAAYIPSALQEVPILVTAVGADNEPQGFMGINAAKIDMLFIAPQFRGLGLGRKFIEYAREKYYVNEVSVNEANVQARGFYEAMGFSVYRRSELDEQGEPYPILFMKLTVPVP